VIVKNGSAPHSFRILPRQRVYKPVSSYPPWSHSPPAALVSHCPT
jgi:hypothetical protein